MDKKRNVEILLILLMLLFNILGCRLVDGQDPGVLPENAELFYNSLVLKADCSFNSTISEEFNCDPTVTLRTKHIDSNLLTWEMSQKNTCSWITINPSSGKLSGTPKRKDLGTCLLAFKVKPSINQNNTSRSSDQLNIDELDEKETNFSSSMTIKPPMLALDFSNCTTAVSIGSFFNCKATANNGLEDSSFTYKLSSSNNCHWASIINPQTGFLTGKPASSDVGKCILGITAIDDLGSQSSKDITINIPEATVDITSTDCRNTGNVSENYSCKVLGSTNLANESILWTRGSNHTCEWITINPTTGEANGKPPLSSSGISCNISIYATILDGYAQGNFVQKINITPVSLTIDNDNCATNISVNTHQTCQASITASISNPVVSWKILSDNNCKFAQVSNSTGNIDLSPSINDVGTCRLSVSASLNESIFTTFKKTITVPSIPINIDLSQCISQLQALNSYNCTALADSNIPGISSYTWKKSTENTCSWIEINSTTGVISGTPAIAQTGPCNLGITASVGNASYSNTKKPISVEIRWFKQSTISDQPWATNDRAGTSISMDNGLIAVGAPEINHGDGSQGQVVIYSQSEDKKTIFLDQIINPDQTNLKGFGYSISLSGNLLLIGAPKSSNPTFNQGAVTIYERQNNGQWTKTGLIWGPSTSSNQYFGASVSANLNEGLIGTGHYAVEAAFYIEKNGSWQITNSLNFSAINSSNGPDRVKVALTDTFAVISDLKGGSSQSGEVHVFTRNTGGFTLQPTPLVGGSYEDFGSSLVANNNYILVSAPKANSNRGKAYLFKKGNGTFIFKQAFDAEADSKYCGRSLSLTEVESKLRVYIGCPEDTNKKGSVFAYFEDTALNTMKLESKVILDSLSEGDLFGSSISADGYDLVVGASHFDIPNTSNSGAFFGFYQK